MDAQFDISLPTRVIFGAGRLSSLPALLTFGAHVLLVRGASGRASAALTEVLQPFGLTEVTCPGEPTAPELSDLLDDLRDTGAAQAVTHVVACGGGSVMDMGKALAGLLTSKHPLSAHVAGEMPGTPLPCITIPTTAGTGAEVTRNAVLGLPDQGTKHSLRGAAFTPTIALVDPDLMQGAPKHVVLGAGLDAVTQLIEAYTSKAATPFTDTISWPSLERALTALKAVLGGDETAWPTLAWCATASGIALSHGGLGAAHGLAAVIGGRFDVPHGALCGRLLAPVLSVNASAPQATAETRRRTQACMDQLRHHFPTDSDNALTGFTDWCAQQGLPRLADWGISAADHAALADAARTASSSLKNPVALESEQFRLILSAAQ